MRTQPDAPAILGVAGGTQRKSGLRAMLKAIVTGHSRGLGAALAQSLLERGVSVLALSRRPNPSLAARFPKTIAEAAIDLSDSGALLSWLTHDEMDNFLDGASAALLVNNAGIVQPIGPAGSLAPDAIVRAVTLNVAAPIALADAFLRASAGIADRRVMHISSGAARNAIPGWSVYCATKAALDHHARVVAADALEGLRIESIAPGVIDTDMQAEIRSAPVERFSQRERFVAMKETNALASPEACGQALAAHLLGDAFGREVATDIRNLG